MKVKSLKESIESFQLARLIPVVADSKKEERATSSLLAAFMSVPTFAKEVLDDVGALSGKKVSIDCYTEVCFKSEGNERNPRPDGLIVLTLGSRQWTALVESKIGNKALTSAQVEEYLDLAKKVGIDALITISNQFAAIPTHHPVKVSKLKTKNVGLFHFSWLSIVSKAIIITDNKKIEDPEQAYILSELVRYLNHDSSGVSSFTQMDNEWRSVCQSLQQGAILSKTSSSVESAVNSWLQLVRHLTLKLSMLVGQPVNIVMSKKRKDDAQLNFSEECNELVTQNILDVEFEIPNAASKLCLTADFLRRTINFSMTLDAPKDRTRATACINWLTRQLKGKENVADLTLRVYWPRRIPMTSTTILNAIEKPESLIPDNVKELPTKIEVLRVVDLMAKFKAPKVFVDECSAQLPEFYNDVGQHLSNWIPQAPKVKARKQEEPTIPIVLSGADEKIVFSEEKDLPNQPVHESAPLFLQRLSKLS